MSIYIVQGGLLLLASLNNVYGETLSCTARSNFFQLSPHESFVLRDGILSNIIKDSYTPLYENVTSFAFYREKGRIYYTNSSGLFSFRDTIYREEGLLILGLVDDVLMFTRGNQVCLAKIKDQDNCMSFVLLGIFVSSLVTFITTASLPLILTKKLSMFRAKINSFRSNNDDTERMLLRPRVLSHSCSSTPK